MNNITQHSWQQSLKNLVTDPVELFALLQLDKQWLTDAVRTTRLFPLRVPRCFIARMKLGDIHDPLLRQVLPLGIEQIETPGYSTDPLAEKNANPVPGLLHKYRNRVLLTPVGACAIHCRYCFRRHFPYEDNNPGKQGWENIVNYITADSDIDEVILSGGDPLVATDEYLSQLTQPLSAIPHVKRLRIHTRLPIVIPERVTDGLIQCLTQTQRVKPVVVIHCNHAQEIDQAVQQALKKMANAQITLLNQSVLLRGINDHADTLVELSHRLFACGVLPYYLHLLDKTQGTAHFDIDEATAQSLMQEMMSRLPGYLVPKLAREIEGMASKQMIFYNHLVITNGALIPSKDKQKSMYSY